MASVPTTSRRERRKEQTRERVVDAAVALFVDRGFDKTTMDEIAEQADVARATVFNHFARKEEIIHAWIERRQDALLASIDLDHLAHTPVTEQLGQVLDVLADINEADRTTTVRAIELWIRSGGPLSSEPFLPALFASILRTGLERGEVRKDADLEAGARLLGAAYLDALFRWAAPDGDTTSLRAMMQSSLEIILVGLVESRTRSRSRRTGP